MLFEMSSQASRRFVMRPVAVKSMADVPFLLRELTSASWSCRSKASLMRAFDFDVRAFAPRRSHSISRWTRFSSACCSFACARRNSDRFSRNLL